MINEERVKSLAGKEIICCPSCCKEHGFEDQYRKSNLRVLGLFGEESHCFVCGLPKGGACFVVPEQKGAKV
jgi:hypothetical protein